jgi:phosphate transport system permease protein
MQGVVESPPTTLGRPHSRTTGDAAVLAFQRRVKLIDLIARGLITVSGIGIIAAVLGIGVFLFLEILPLLRGARLSPGVERAVLAPAAVPHLVLVDEYQELALVVGGDPAAQVVRLAGTGGPETVVPLEGLEGHRVTAAARVPGGSRVAVGTAQGRVWVGTMELRAAYEGATRSVSHTVQADQVFDLAPGHEITRLAYQGDETAGLALAIVDGSHVVAARIATQRPLVGPARHSLESFPIRLGAEAGVATQVLVPERLSYVWIGTSTGTVNRWHLPAARDAEEPVAATTPEPSAELIQATPAVPNGGVTALTFILGERSIAVGGGDGSVATWSLVRDEASPDGWTLMHIHPFPRGPGAVTALAPSPRDKGFLASWAGGETRLLHMTSERTLGRFTVPGGVAAMTMAPKANGALLLSSDGRLHQWRIANPHPEVSWRALFGKVWYEGYEEPEYIWQSTGGTDDFESKFSLVPLIVGTLKGTWYAMVFAVPLALFGALYCSQFLDKRLRNPVKSTIELMAALPSVVLGFVTGVLLAPLVQGQIAAVLAAPLIVPGVALGAAALARLLPGAAGARARQHEFWILTAAAALGVLAAWAAGPWIERAVFGGNFQHWLLQTTGTRYDQRNSLVIGWAMGFAVIPIIFTICEDAFSAVPKHLVGASLACGASAWQTAWRVVLPAAGSGVFSAIMVGFGRAVGETMIVLMATGNTPIMDWSVFNGFRALSANIAVEIPEAPQGGTLYRVLFIAALMLFSMTFLVNTVAEVIRLRLRRQLQGL